MDVVDRQAAAPKKTRSLWRAAAFGGGIGAGAILGLGSIGIAQTQTKGQSGALPPLSAYTSTYTLPVPPDPAINSVDQATRFLLGKQFYTCADTNIFSGPLLPELQTGGDRLTKNQRLIGARLTVKETHIVPFTGADGGYRVFLGLAWVKSINSKASEFQEAVMQDIRVHKDGPAGRWLPSEGMTESQVYCTYDYPDSTNDYGDDLQLIYDGGRTVVYISRATSKVTTVHRFEE